MAGFMDFFSQATGGQASGLNDLLSEEQRRAINQQSMMAMAAQLLQAGGPSDKRTSLGQALGQGYTAAQQAQQTGQTNALTQMMTRQKIDEYKAEQAVKARLGKIFAPESLTPAQASLAAPVSAAGPVGPTMKRAEIAASPAPSNPKVDQAAKYRQAAALYGTDPVKAKAYMDIADQLDPRQEVTGQPFKLTDQSGQDVMVQQMKDGTVRTMPGFGPPREVVLQSFGGKTVAIDKSKLQGNEVYTHTMTPGEAASNFIAQGNLNLRNKEFERGAFAIKDTPEGYAYVPTTPGGVVSPVLGTGGAQVQPAKEAPADFSKASKKLSDLEGNLKAYKAEVESDKVVFPSQVPLPFGASIPLPTGEDTARMRGRYQSLLMGVKDLYELGALTGPDMGIVSDQITNPASFSGVFTSRNAMKEQIGVLEDMLARSKENLSSTYKRPLPASSTSGLDASKPQPKSSRPARLVYDPVSKNYRYVQE